MDDRKTKLILEWYEMVREQAKLIIRHDYLDKQIYEVIKQIEACDRRNATFDEGKK